MKAAIRFLALASALVCLPGSALATGGLDCSIDDANLAFDVHALFSYSGNGGLFDIGGHFQSKNPKTSVRLKAFDIKAEDLKQQWFYGTDLKLQFYAETRNETDPFASISLAIETQQVPDDELRYTGTYILTIQPEVGADGSSEDPFDLNGKISCSAG
jgi:hypothetical protein